MPGPLLAELSIHFHFMISFLPVSEFCRPSSPQQEIGDGLGLGLAVRTPRLRTPAAALVSCAGALQHGAPFAVALGRQKRSSRGGAIAITQRH